MLEAALAGQFLQGKQVAITGRLASLSRASAAALIQSHGGQLIAKVSRRADYLVVGQDGLPIESDGALTANLRKTRLLQKAGHQITILSEEELLTRLGMEKPCDSIHQLYSTSQLSRLLTVSGSQLRKWVEDGLIRANHSVKGVNYFDYSQVASARTLCSLVKRGVTPAKLRHSLEQMKAWLGDIDQPLQQLALLDGHGKVLVRVEDGLVEPSGQGCLDFDSSTDSRPTVTMARPHSAEELFERACEEESRGNLDYAIECYRQALRNGGPSATLCFNLGNALCNSGKKKEAIERYYQAVELDSSLAEAWNNLGVTLADHGRTQEAQHALRNALAASPEYADAHYNLADLLDGLNLRSQARPHWEAYLACDRDSAWAAHARKQIAAAR